MIEKLDKILNKEQYEAATAGDGPMLVLAAAGTGKTQTLVYRVAYLVDKGVAPDSILLLTFTNKAANEMLERATQVVGGAVTQIWSGTFHSVCNRILRLYANQLGYRNRFVIADRDDSRKLIERAMKEVGVGGDAFPKKDVLASYFSGAANRSLPLETVLYEKLGESPFNVGDILKVYDVYNRLKKEECVMDFDDLLINCVKLFEMKPEILNFYQRRFAYILVDEYQDTNFVQSRFVDMLAAGHRNIMAVGDDFQCIYGWRGADFRNIMDFPKRYPDAGIIKLEQNYRSTPEILEVANACIACNTEQFQKTLYSTFAHGIKPTVFNVYNTYEQSTEIISLIRHYLNMGYKYSDIAVLYRSHFHSLDLQMTLTKSRIPFVITSGIGFFETAHAKDFLSLLRLIVNPHDRLAFERIFSIFPGMGPQTIAKLWLKLGSICRLDTPEGRAAAVAALKASVRPLWEPVSQSIESYFKELSADGKEPVVSLARAFLASHYYAYLQKEYENADDRYDDILELASQIEQRGSLVGFLEDVALITNLDAENNGETAGAKANSVRLSTIHQAKGLEWSVVIVPWCCEEMFPSAKSIKENEDDSEERRLFYVAVTRARHALFLFVPNTRKNYDGSFMPCKPSRFIQEIPKNLLGFTRGI